MFLVKIYKYKKVKLLKRVGIIDSFVKSQKAPQPGVYPVLWCGRTMESTIANDKKAYGLM